MKTKIMLMAFLFSLLFLSTGTAVNVYYDHSPTCNLLSSEIKAALSFGPGYDYEVSYVQIALNESCTEANWVVTVSNNGAPYQGNVILEISIEYAPFQFHYRTLVLPSILQGSSYTTSYTTTGITSEGACIRAIVDPFNNISETNESNNFMNECDFC